MKRRLALILTFAAGSIPIVAFFFPDVPVPIASRWYPTATLDWVASRFESWMVIIAGFALPLGVFNVLGTHSKKIARKEQGWFYSVAVIAGLLAMGGAGVVAVFGYPAAGIGKNPDGSSTPFDWLFNTFFSPLQGTMFALLAFFMASAAYRAFRVRSFQATLLLIAAVVVMLGRVPFGEMLFGWIGGGVVHITSGTSVTVPPGSTWLASLTNWIMDKPNSAAQSGIIIGAALGAASMSLRVILGLETSYLGKGKEG